MKRILLPTVLLGACAGTALAQSSVTIFGIIDLGMVKANDGASTLHGAPADNTLRMEQGARSRLGFRGTEDLGGGLRANFVLEHSFLPDTGTALSPTTFWHGQSWVGLSGGFGEVRLGRDYAPGHLVAFRSDPFTFDTVAQVGINHAWAGYTSGGGASRYNNSLSYKTPSFGGFTAQVATSLSEADGVDNGFGAGVVYANGPLYFGLAYDRKDDTLGKNDLIIATGTYTIGAFTPR